MIKILKNTEVNYEQLKILREMIMSESDMDKFFLGISDENIDSYLNNHISNQYIWLILKENTIAGAVSFSIEENDSIFIKLFYINNKFRSQGLGIVLMGEILSNFKYITCNLNTYETDDDDFIPNFAMINLLKKFNITGLKSAIKDFHPYMYSNIPKYN